MTLINNVGFFLSFFIRLLTKKLPINAEIPNLKKRKINGGTPFKVYLITTEPKPQMAETKIRRV
jgi:hypothetical protein